jgi:ATP-dependent protease ClpP protease subunit
MSDNENLSQKDEEIKEFGSSFIRSKRGNVYCLTIIGQIEGHMILSPQTKSTKYEHILPQLVWVEENEDIDGMIVLLNTVGGDVEAGLAISEMISTMKKPCVSLVLGGGHSIGVPLAVSSKKSFIAPSATMTIHPMRINGTVIGAPQTFMYMDKMQQRIVEFVTRNSRISKEKFLKLMLDTDEIANDIGTVLFGDEAVKNGLIDKVGGLDAALSCLYEMIKDEKTKNDGKGKIDKVDNNARK